MFRQTLIAAAAISLLAINPALASTARTEVNVQTKAKVIQRGGQTLYCVKETTTGSRMPRTVCLTERDLADAGAVIKPANAAPAQERIALRD